MSSEMSMNIEIINLEDIELLNSLVEEVGFHPFEEVYLSSFLRDRSKEISDILFENNLIEVMTNVFCERFNLEERLDSTCNNQCPICKENIQNSDHETTMIYKFDKKSVALIKNLFKKKLESKYLMYEYKQNLEMLLNDKDSLVPFLGAGVSRPMGLPGWTELLTILGENFVKDSQKEEYDDLLCEGDFMGALDYLRSKSPFISTKDQLKEKIIEIIDDKLLPNVGENTHNYFDLAKIDTNFFITTNYDLCMVEFLSAQGKYAAPQVLADISNIRSFMKSKSQVIHLHGYVKRKDTMIVSKEDYEPFYRQTELLVQFASIIANRPLLFIGFSFNDKFFEDLYDKLQHILNTQHYIIIPNPTLKEAISFNRRNLKVIGLKVDENKNDDLVEAIRVLINYIAG
ncbi:MULTISPECIES: SIR2 family NAD-dependent protein deacylase [Paenibacillus]|uniref:SIR2 family NAD-dependent protein deacylase n=1 Tax=Paenibacillus TaxID=44249 RepID=UPI001352E9BC|nr:MULTISPECIES: SIR2 family protein [Paenibacillus]MDY8025809.1 SIR2 family protein [Paenibacillus polymyxa]MXO77699.1 hypothetical protein [Paenibacillus sp. OT2-17]